MGFYINNFTERKNYRLSLNFILLCLLLVVAGCISPFDPIIEGEDSLLVVDASLIKGIDTQTIILSKTARISNPGFIPYEDCEVKVMDSTGNEFAFNEESPGNYSANIDDLLLKFNMTYKLVFTTPSGDIYESDYQRLLRTAPVDSLYGLEEYHFSSATNTESVSGIQFYVDLDAPADASRYYRWVLEETWENRADREIWGVYDGQTIKRFYPSDSLYRCWKTKDVTGLYSASTINLSENRKDKIPLHFVESHSPRMSTKYCATIKQYALNADAYDYWYEKERELIESGSIYTIQPSQSKSNIYNTKNPDELVMGFFWVASCSVKRVFIKSLHSPEGISCGSVGAYCESTDFDEIADQIYSALLTFDDILPDPPLYITVQYNTNYNIIITPPCVDCRVLGGVARKPEFWEEGE